MKYRVTNKSGETYEFDSPFTIASLQKAMGLPSTSKIEIIQPKESQDGQTSTTVVEAKPS